MRGRERLAGLDLPTWAALGVLLAGLTPVWSVVAGLALALVVLVPRALVVAWWAPVALVLALLGWARRSRHGPSWLWLCRPYRCPGLWSWLGRSWLRGPWLCWTWLRPNC